MPKGRKRFGFLEKALKAAGGNAAPGSRLGNYSEFKKGNRKIEVNKKLSPADRKRYAVAIIPFGTDHKTTYTNQDRYQVGITFYSDSARKDLQLTDALVGYASINADNKQSDDYYPALLRCFIPDNPTAAPAQPTSGVTGQKYSRRAGKSVSIPFGKGATVTQGEQTRRVALTEVAKNDTGKTATGVSYVPEYFDATKVDIPALPGV